MHHPVLEAPTRAAGAGTPFVLDTILDHSSWAARRLSRRKKKMLVRIQEKVRAILEPGEQVRYATFGSRVSFWEAYWMGWVAYYINRRAILATDRRLILLQIDSRDHPKELVSQVRYSSIRKVRRTLFGSTVMTFGDGKRSVFSYVPRRDRKFLQRLTDWIDRSLERGTGGWEELCPHCYAQVTGRPAECPACGGGLKPAWKAGLLSLAFPGLGDIYLGHWKFAILEIGAAAMIWLSVLASAAEVHDPWAALAAGLFLLVFGHGADAVATWYVGRRGLYPARRP